MDLLLEAGNFDILIDSIRKTGIDSILTSPAEEVTLFAPHNVAFDDVPEDVRDEYNNDPQLLGNLLLNHIVRGKYTYEDLADVDELVTLGGSRLKVDHSREPGLKVNNAIVEIPNYRANNGVIHIIDDIMKPMAVLAT
jgi:uncharacterized surface protein with fasciclin (FAS1) repeats